MKDIYSPLEIDEEWDNYAPAADGSSTALMERPVGVSTDGLTEGNGLNTEGAMATKIAVTSPDDMSKSNVMPGINDSPGDGTKEPDQTNIAYDAAEALIDKPAADADLVTTPDTTPGFAATDGDTFDINDTRGLVKITPDEPTSDKPAPETTIAGTPHDIEPVKISVMGGETPDSNDTLPDPIDQSKGGTSSPDVPVITPYIAPVEPGEEPKDETKGDSDIVIDTGTITPDTGEKSTDTFKASDDDGESSSDDDTENAEADTSSSDSADKSSETKADKPKAPTSAGDDELAGILDKWDQSNKEIADMLKAARKEIEANVLRMSDQKTNLKTDLEQQIADLDEGIANENARLAKIETNLAKLPSDEAN